MPQEIAPPTYNDPTSLFHISKSHLHQIGIFSWENRYADNFSMHLLSKVRNCYISFDKEQDF